MDLGKVKTERILDLKTFLSQYPDVGLAHKEDSPEILDFFKTQSMGENRFNLVYDRSPNFFSLLESHSKEYFVFIYRPGGIIQGVATMVIREGYVNSTPSKVAYLGDLRLSLSRRSAILWRKIYAQILINQKNICELRDIKAFYTCLMDSNPLSKMSLVKKPRDQFRYHPVCMYKMINVYASLKIRNSKGYRIDIAKKNELADIRKFVSLQESDLQGGYRLANELEKRLDTWSGFSMESIGLVKNSQDEIKGLVALWNPKDSKRILIKGNRKWAKIFLKYLGKLKLLGLSKAGEISYLYGTSLTIDSILPKDEKKQVVRLLAQFGVMQAKKSGSLYTFCDFNKDSHLPYLKNTLYFSIPMTIYEVTNSKVSPPRCLDRYGFEMALV